MALVIVTDPLAMEGIRAIEEAGHEARCFQTPDEARTAGVLKDAEMWVVRSGTQVGPADFEAATKLKAIARAGVGVDNVDLEAATAHGVAVFNAPTGNITSAAEQAWALMLGAARRIGEADAAMKNEEWARKRLKGVELAGKTIFLVGLGRIGRMMAARAQAFEMTVLGYDPYVNAEAAAAFGVERVEVDDGVGRANFISLHTPLVPQTRHILNKERFDLMTGAIVVNAARGGLIDETALLAALESGHVLAAGMDVWQEEPPTDWTLAKHPRVVAAPHLGASTAEAQTKAATQAVGRALHFLATGDAGEAVNSQATLDKATKPWAMLAEDLASFGVQNVPQVEQISIHATEGLALPALRTHALVGALRNSRRDAVNAINAPGLADSSGWTVAEQVLPAAQPDRLAVTVSGGGRSIRLEGTHTAHYGSRVTSVDNFDVEFRPHGRFIVTRHQDVPGVLAKITQILAEEQANVGSMSLARDASSKIALAVIEIDGAIPKDARDILRTVPEVLEAHRVKTVLD